MKYRVFVEKTYGNGQDIVTIHGYIDVAASTVKEAFKSFDNMDDTRHPPAINDKRIHWDEGVCISTLYDLGYCYLAGSFGITVKKPPVPVEIVRVDPVQTHQPHLKG